MNTLPTATEREEERDAKFIQLMDIIRYKVDEETQSTIIKIWADANYCSRFIGWEEGYNAGRGN